MNLLRRGSAGSGVGRRALRPALLTAGAGALAVAVAAGAYVAGGVLAPGTAPAREPLAVRTMPAERVEHYTVRRAYVGAIEPRRRSDVGFELAGQVARVHVDDGDLVEQGQVLAELDTARLSARRAELVAQRTEAQARAELASLIHARTRRAYDADAATQRELDEARQSMLAAEAVVTRVERQIDAVDVDLAKSVLRAPFEAVVARRHVDEGRVVGAGTVVLSLLERTAPEARIGVPPRTAAHLEVGDRVTVLVHGQRHDAHVHRLLPVTDRGTRTVELVLRLDAPFDRLRDGDQATVTLARRIDGEAYWLPLSALTESVRGLWACYVAEPVVGEVGEEVSGATHRLARRQLEIVHTEAERALVRGTLRPGERVVADGLHRVVTGQWVRLADAEPAHTADGPAADARERRSRAEPPTDSSGKGAP